jgi:hypothetical protein
MSLKLSAGPSPVKAYRGSLFFTTLFPKKFVNLVFLQSYFQRKKENRDDTIGKNTRQYPDGQ